MKASRNTTSGRLCMMIIMPVRGYLDFLPLPAENKHLPTIKLYCYENEKPTHNFCIFTLLTVNLVHARWPSVDPHAENYYPQSPYSFAGGNPVNNIELDGKDWYKNRNGDMMWRRMQDKTYTDDNSVVWTNAGTTYLHQRNNGSAIYFSQGTNDDGELTLSSHGLSWNEMSVFGLFHSGKAKMSAMEDHVNPSAGSFAKMMGSGDGGPMDSPLFIDCRGNDYTRYTTRAK